MPCRKHTWATATACNSSFPNRLPNAFAVRDVARNRNPEATSSIALQGRGPRSSSKQAAIFGANGATTPPLSASEPKPGRCGEAVRRAKFSPNHGMSTEFPPPTFSLLLCELFLACVAGVSGRQRCTLLSKWLNPVLASFSQPDGIGR